VTVLAASILEACDNEGLFGAAFSPWPTQREVLALIEEARLTVVCCGRRGGKTTLSALSAVHSCLLAPGLDRYVQPGETRYAVVVATTLKQARLLVSQARQIVERSPLLAGLIESVSEDEIRFVNNTCLAAFPCSSRGARGWPIHYLALDEAAHFIDSEGNQAGERLWEAMAPATAQFGDDATIVVTSTPFGTDGFFADLYVQADGMEGAARAQFATTEMNPTIDAAFLERERLRDPESFRSEYLAEFVGSGSAYLDPERLEAAVVGPLMPVSPELCVDWTAGIDPAFSNDPFGLAIVGTDSRRPDKLIVGQVMSWKPNRPESFEERRLVEDQILAEVARECLRYGASATTDQYASRAVVDRLERAGVSVKAVPMTATSKTAAFAELRSMIYTGQLELPDYKPLLDELRRLRTRYTAGSASVVNPRVGGSHGDLAQALAMAVWDRDPSGAAFAMPTIGPPAGTLAGDIAREMAGAGHDPDSFASEDAEDRGGHGGVYSPYGDSPLDDW
jgi:phage terminase large subunit-like protein